MSNSPLKVSYCTTCKGRLHYLMKTLPKNLEAERDNPNVEFVILDYDSDDTKNCGELTIAQWLKDYYSKEIATGRIRYVRTENQPYFQMAHAKNMAHRASTGDILCNLDADNFLAPDFSKWLTSVFQKEPKSIVTMLSKSLRDDLFHAVNKRMHSASESSKGMTGRIAIMRQDYERLHGYSEKFNDWGGDDINFAMRARNIGLDFVKIPEALWSCVIPNTNEERLENLSPANRASSEAKLNANDVTKKFVYVGRRLGAHNHPSNPSGSVGCGSVIVNFDHVVRISPMEPTRAGFNIKQDRHMSNTWGETVKKASVDPQGIMH